MRTKKLFTLLVAGALVLTVVTKTNAKGGGENRLSIGAELALPMGTFGDMAGMGFGGSVRYEMPMGDNLGLTGTAGYLTFGGKSIDLIVAKFSYTYSMIPIMVGAKYYFQEQQNGFYGMGQLGITMTSIKTESTISYFGTSTTVSATGSSSDLTFSPGVGYHLDNIDIGANYMIVSTAGASSSYLGVRLAYVLGSK
ncbi:MAG: outer membrane beta-barrel protein [Bacteroidetes bacterium]|nr:outer membrane beta-barrel protein [Bacteroidota bacterium]